MTERLYLNMTAQSWRRLRSNWKLPWTAPLLYQTYIAGPFFSALNSYQNALTAAQRKNSSLSESIVVLGYWRSGTTLLHNYLCHDKRFGFPSTYACMNPQHFILTQAAALKRMSAPVRRPMDDVQIYPSSPQEDEFGLLALGARSPYEALLAPHHLAAALDLGDPRDLSAGEEIQWQEIFSDFLRGISIVEGGRPLILKSPPHGYRVATLRELLPDVRFVLIVRSPDIVYESTVRMWRNLFSIYGLGSTPPEDDTRKVILADRPRFEAKLAAGLLGLPHDRLAIVQYEALVRDPLDVIGLVYEQLRLGGYSEVEQAIKADIAQHRQYTARNALPSGYWLRQVQEKWRPIFERYHYNVEF